MGRSSNDIGCFALIVYLLYFLGTIINDKFPSWIFYSYIITISLIILYSLFQNTIANELKTCKHGVRKGNYSNCEKCRYEKDTKNLFELKQKSEKEKKYKIEVEILENKHLIHEKISVFNSQSIEKLYAQSPFEFENSVANIYKALGYKTQVTSKSNDGGKDIIMYKEGKKYLVECKKYSKDNLVTRPELQKFMAAIYQEKAIKGYFVTTSDYTSTGYAYPKDVNEKIELINGEGLVKLFYSAFPSKSKSISYHMICIKCGESVEFKYPGKLESVCSNEHTVISNIEDIIKEKESSSKGPKKSSSSPLCPKCNSKMRKIWSKVNKEHFWGCNNYPICKKTLPLKSRLQ